jgi:uncharacterized membrane protein YfcA
MKQVPQNMDEFKLERYKYILQEMRSLNDNTHKYLTLFQTLATLIIGGGVGVFVGWKSLRIPPDAAIAGINGLLILLVVLGLFVITSIAAGMISWFDYRNEEVELLDQVQQNFRKKPNLRNFWRWTETYMIGFIVTVVIFICFYIESQIVPLIH